MPAKDLQRELEKMEIDCSGALDKDTMVELLVELSVEKTIEAKKREQSAAPQKRGMKTDALIASAFHGVCRFVGDHVQESFREETEKPPKDLKEAQGRLAAAAYFDTWDRFLGMMPGPPTSGRAAQPSTGTAGWEAEVARAAFSLASGEQGAQILLLGNGVPQSRHAALLDAAGCPFTCDVKAEVLHSFFHKHGPLHDGAVLLRDGLVLGARVPLFISWSERMEAHGTRHYSAKQFFTSFHPHVAAVAVSEETGRVSFFCGDTQQVVASESELASLISARVAPG